MSKKFDQEQLGHIVKHASNALKSIDRHVLVIKNALEEINVMKELFVKDLEEIHRKVNPTLPFNG